MTTPSGCRHCGAEERSHPWLWTAEAGLHQYVPPTTPQIKERMLAHRAAKGMKP